MIELGRGNLPPQGLEMVWRQRAAVIVEAAGDLGEGQAFGVVCGFVLTPHRG
jgi:hypothetical protein